MKNRQEKNWEMLQQMLEAGARGDEPRPLVSTRTLFGIKSSLEEQLERIVEEDQKQRRAGNGTEPGGETQEEKS